jgi:hypothetical protein
MASGEFGGDGSVGWRVEADNVRFHSSEAKANNGRIQRGIDETPANASFTVTIRVPLAAQNDAGVRAEFLKDICAQLSSSLQSVGGIWKMQFELPIEPGNVRGDGHADQIVVSWPSA